MAISIQSTGQGPHLKAIYLSQRNLVLLRLNLSRQSDPIIKIILANYKMEKKIDKERKLLMALIPGVSLSRFLMAKTKI